MQPQIRDALPADAEAIGRLMRVLGYELAATHAAERLAVYGGDFSKVWVACHEGEIIGFLAFHAIPLFHEAAMLGRITAMSVEPRCQRQGVGAALVRKAEDFALSVGCLRMEVTSGDRREHEAHLFYQAIDYRSECRRFIKHLVDRKTGGDANPLLHASP